MNSGDHAETRRQAAAFALLAVAGAGVDAVLIITTGILTAAQTGNTILLAVAVARGDFTTGVSAALSVAAFVVGALYGSAVIAKSRDARSGAVRVLLSEVLLLAALFFVRLWFSRPGHFALGEVAAAAVAMGMQSSVGWALHAVQPTTYVTGGLTGASAGLVSAWFRMVPPHAGSTGLPPWIAMVTWALYLGSAIFSAVLYAVCGAWILLVPVLMVGIAAFLLRRL